MAPAPNDLILEQPKSVTFDSHGSLFILDTGQYCVLKFNEDLQLIKKAGRYGQGPLEFGFRNRARNEGHLKVDLNDNVCVFELENSRVQLIKNDLSAVMGNWCFQKFIYSIALGNEGRIYAMSINRPKQTLIDMYNSAGVYLSSFNDMFIVNPPSSYPITFNNSMIAVNCTGDILAVNRLTPIIRIFSGDGLLKIERQLDLEEISRNEELLKYYRKNPDIWEFETRPIGKSELVQFVVKQVCSHGDNFYLLLMFDEVVKLTKSGEVTDVYELDFDRYTGESSCFGLDFDVFENKIVLVTGNSMALLFQEKETAEMRMFSP
ncbi:hypothetical protein JXO52_17925 [bacterium]|nr:hypothetical protein [bacterium]